MARRNKIVAVPVNDAIKCITSFINGNPANQLSNDYCMLFAEVKEKLELMAKLEIILVQQKCIKNMDIKLDVTRGYIYARTPFFKPTQLAKDIRVLVAKTSDDLSQIELMKIAEEKLIAVMQKEFNKNLEEVLILNDK